MGGGTYGAEDSAGSSIWSGTGTRFIGDRTEGRTWELPLRRRSGVSGKYKRAVEIYIAAIRKIDEAFERR